MLYMMLYQIKIKKYFLNILVALLGLNHGNLTECHKKVLKI